MFLIWKHPAPGMEYCQQSSINFSTGKLHHTCHSPRSVRLNNSYASLQFLIRTRILSQRGEKEQLRDENQKLKTRVHELETQLEKAGSKAAKEEVPV